MAEIRVVQWPRRGESELLETSAFVHCFELYRPAFSPCPLEYCWGTGRVNSSFVQSPAQVVALCAGVWPSLVRLVVGTEKEGVVQGQFSALLV